MKLTALFLLISFHLFAWPFSAIAQTTDLITSGVTYNSDSSVNISRPSDSVRLPTNPISPTQGWVAIRVKMGFASSTTLAPDPIMWDMSETDPSGLFIYYDIDTDRFRMARGKSGVGGDHAVSAAQTFSVGSVKTIIGAWDATSVKISIDGAPFITTTTVANAIPAPAPFYIGSSVQQGAGRQPNSDYYWVAAGTGALTDVNATTIHAFGNTDKNRSDFPGSAAFIWWAGSDAYNNDGGAPPPPPVQPPPPATCSNSADSNNDGQINMVDFLTLVRKIPALVTGKTNGDFNCDGKATVMDFALLFKQWNTGTPPPPPPSPVQPPPPPPVQPPPPPPTGGVQVNDLSDPRINCSKYPEKRVFLETQSWWMDASSVGSGKIQRPLNGIGGHIHEGACWPQDQQISKPFQLDVRLMMHKGMASDVSWLRWGIVDGKGAQIDFSPKIDCSGTESDITKNCTFWHTVTVDPTGSTGYKEFRMSYNVPHTNGERQFPSMGWQAWYNGGTSTYRNPPVAIARSWYTGSDYTNSGFFSPFPYEPVSGIWSFNAFMKPGSGGSPTTYHGVHIDARFNMDDFGITVMEGPGEFSGKVSIDTTKLTNGVHWLAIKGDSKVGNGVNTVIFQMPFTVRN